MKRHLLLICLVVFAGTLFCAQGKAVPAADSASSQTANSKVPDRAAGIVVDFLGYGSVS